MKPVMYNRSLDLEKSQLINWLKICMVKGFRILGTWNLLLY